MISFCFFTKSCNSWYRVKRLFFLLLPQLEANELSNYLSSSQRLWTIFSISAVQTLINSSKSFTNSLSHKLLMSSIFRYIFVYTDHQEVILLLFFYLYKFSLDCDRFNDFELLLLMHLESGLGMLQKATDYVLKRADVFFLPQLASSMAILAFKLEISILYIVRSWSSTYLSASFFELFSTQSQSMSYSEYFHFQYFDQIGCLRKGSVFHFQFIYQVLVILFLILHLLRIEIRTLTFARGVGTFRSYLTVIHFRSLNQYIILKFLNCFPFFSHHYFRN